MNNDVFFKRCDEVDIHDIMSKIVILKNIVFESIILIIILFVFFVI